MSAQTATTGWPGKRASSPIMPGSRSTASTPGSALASSTFTETTLARACGHRTTRANARFGRFMSPVYRAPPFAFASPSTRGTSVPTTTSFASIPHGAASPSSIFAVISLRTSPAPTVILTSGMGYLPPRAAAATADAAARTWG